MKEKSTKPPRYSDEAKETIKILAYIIIGLLILGIVIYSIGWTVAPRYSDTWEEKVVVVTVWVQSSFLGGSSPRFRTNSTTYQEPIFSQVLLIPGEKVTLVLANKSFVFLSGSRIEFKEWYLGWKV